ncbi:unnamed protein product [Ectocarpus sp. 13 AM-2016]
MRRMFLTFTALLVAVACAGLSRNAGSKFVRTRVQQGCRRNYANVATIRSREKPSLDLICCTGSVEDDAVCIGGGSQTTKILITKLAFVIPLAALAVNAFCDWLAGGATPSRTRARWNRFLLYVAVMLGRTLGLYFGLNYIQDLVQAEESSNCWYAHLRRSGRCSEHFDFADHVVLAVCQYYAIQASPWHRRRHLCVFELCCILREYGDFSRQAAAIASGLQRKSSPTPLSSPSPSSSSSSRLSPHPPPPLRPSPYLSVLPAAAVCAAVAGAALLLVYDTAAFFHSRAETVAALIISWFVVGEPLLSLTGGAAVAAGGGGTVS